MLDSQACGEPMTFPSERHCVWRRALLSRLPESTGTFPGRAAVWPAHPSGRWGVTVTSTTTCLSAG